MAEALAAITSGWARNRWGNGDDEVAQPNITRHCGNIEGKFDFIINDVIVIYNPSNTVVLNQL